MKRQNIVAGNWKMNKTLEESKGLIKSLKKKIGNLELINTRVLISPTFVTLHYAAKKTRKSRREFVPKIVHEKANGAYTGEVSVAMLKSVGVKTVIVGHSERRAYYNESNGLLAKKVEAARKGGLEIIFCFGEKWEDRKEGQHFDVVESQIKEALFHLESTDFENIILAYEPVWAIGTGQTASADQAQEMHAFIRGILKKRYNSEVSDAVSILYGGSVKPNNAEEIFSKKDVDGGLIGGASLNPEDFIAIVKAI